MTEPSPTRFEDDASAQTHAAAPQIIVQTAPPRRKRRFFWGLLTGCLVVFVLLTTLSVIAAFYADGTGPTLPIGNKVAVIPVEGEIFDVRDAIDDLHAHRDNRAIKAIIIRINSPGGAIAPSQELYQEILDLREESDKPIIASLDSVAASGGYYIASACDAIVANPGSITGSIGVIVQWFNLEELVRWAKMKPETITSGRMKDAGSPFREFSEEERAYFQALTNQLHQQFVRAVAAGRKGKLSQDEVARLADGRVFTGEEALKLKLVDQLGNLQDAVELSAEMASIEGDPDVVYPKPREGSLLDLLGGETKQRTQLLERFLSTRQSSPFLYRW
jgi:protease IV